VHMNLNKFKMSTTLLGAIFIIFAFIPVLRVDASILNDKEEKWLFENSSNVYFAPEKDFPPMIWSRYDVLFGISNDYFDLMQQLIGTRFSVRAPRNLSEILNTVRATGESSIISSVTVTPQRLEFLIFTRPYFSSPAIFIANNNKTITGSDIEEHNYSVAVGNGFGVYDYLKDRYKSMKLVSFENDYQVIQAVLDKHTDFGVLDAASLTYILRENDLSGINKVGNTGFVYNFAFAVPKDMPELRNILDEAIQAIPQSFNRSVLEKWNVDNEGLKRLIGEANVAVVDDQENLVWYFFGFIIIVLLSDFMIGRYILKLEKVIAGKKNGLLN
jgi:ABC-type amino acid transport substrate-binding protein